MRNTVVFAGSSCPALTAQICSNLGMTAAPAELGKFANGETSVKLLTSIRDKDVFVVQSGSTSINDSIMELLIMISACKGGSANKITAVLPYFPYSRQSKKKSHRGAITARMLANLLHVAGVKHVITIDLHASQMQGFFRCPVDNLTAEPLIARWIKLHVRDWESAVCVSKNAGGTKRVTSLADTLKLNFGMVTTDKRRILQLSNSVIFNGSDSGRTSYNDSRRGSEEARPTEQPPSQLASYCSQPSTPPRHTPQHPLQAAQAADRPIRPHVNTVPVRGSPLTRAHTAPVGPAIPEDDAEYTDERAREVIHGRLVQGHIVPDDYPSPIQSMSNSMILDQGCDEVDPLSLSRPSSFFGEPHALGGTGDAGASSDDEETGFATPGLEQKITIVGDVKGRQVFIVDDMIDKPGSWIAAAEAVVKRGGAKRVYCIATHGLFGGDSLEVLERCECIDQIVVTNSFPISAEKARQAKKLVILDLAGLLSEAIRRSHFGESVSVLFH